MADESYTVVPTKEEYLRIAAQYEQRACSAKTEAERQGYLTRAEWFRWLGARRLEVNSKEAHFVGTLRRARRG